MCMCTSSHVSAYTCTNIMGQILFEDTTAQGPNGEVNPTNNNKNAIFKLQTTFLQKRSNFFFYFFFPFHNKVLDTLILK
jgi:hypothetical protein